MVKMMGFESAGGGQPRAGKDLPTRIRFNAMSKLVAKYPHYVNQYFMKRTFEFIDGDARDILGIKYY